MEGIIGIDWLQFSCKGKINDMLKLKTYTFDLKGSTKQFDSWYIVSKDNMPMFDVCCHPQSKIIPADTINIRVYNHLLYDLSCFDVINDFIYHAKMTYNNMTRIDVYYDTQEFKFTEFAQKFFKKEYYLKGIHKGSFFYNTKSGDYAAETFHVNKPNSPVSMKIYDKTLEMENKGQKLYVTDTWQLANFDMTKKVVRIEMSINGSSNIYAPDENITVFDFKQIELVLALFLNTVRRFKFYKRSRTCTDKRILYFDDIKPCEIVLVRKYTLPKSVRQTRYVANQITQFLDNECEHYPAMVKGDIRMFIGDFTTRCTMIDRKCFRMTAAEINELKREIKSMYQYKKQIFE